MAPLLPKLRGHFAEFLNHDSLDRLSILYLTTCVGFGYGRLEPHVDAFLGSIGSPDPPPTVGAHQISPTPAADLPTTAATFLDLEQPSPGPATFLRHTCYYVRSTASGPTLHPPAPPRKERSRGFRVVSLSSFTWTVLRRYGNINPSAIDYACRPRLRTRLTQGRLA